MNSMYPSLGRSLNRSLRRSLAWSLAAIAASVLVCATALASDHSPEKAPGFDTLMIAPAQILESPEIYRSELPWETSTDSIQARLYDAVSSAGPASGVHQTAERSFLIRDKMNRIHCEAGQTGLLQVMTFRCTLNLVARYLDWSSSESSAQSLLFHALVHLHDNAHDRVSTLSGSETDESTLIRLVDDDSASKIVCESRRTQTASEREYRCLFDVKP